MVIDKHKILTVNQSSTALYLVDVYGRPNGASALAANGLVRYTLGAVFPLFAIQSNSPLLLGRFSLHS